MSGNSKEIFGQNLSSRRFSLADQTKFSAFSGDKNPIHIDPVAARRTLSGQCIVHGMHSLLWALDSLAREAGVTTSELKVNFLNPIFLGEKVECIWDEMSQSVVLLSESVKVATISIKPGAITANDAVRTGIQMPRDKPQELSFLECSELPSQPFRIFGNEELSKKLFPSFSAVYGSNISREIASISQIVGMECPGLHSLFRSLSAQIGLTNNSVPRFKVTRSDQRIKRLEILVEGTTVVAEVEAYYRPPPVRNPRISEIVNNVNRNEFKDIRALIVGGSRGLGELVAKLVAAGGGRPTITYNVGKMEAEQLVEEIHAWGGECEAIQFTINKETCLPPSVSAFNQLYYFATPKILSNRSETFNERIFMDYLDIYVNAFNDICEDIVARHIDCSVFYPSTTFIDDPPPEYAGYVKAKITGEELCKTLSKKHRSLNIIKPRLPPLETDQTNSLVRHAYTDSVTVMLPLVRDMLNPR